MAKVGFTQILYVMKNTSILLYKDYRKKDVKSITV